MGTFFLRLLQKVAHDVFPLAEANPSPCLCPRYIYIYQLMSKTQLQFLCGDPDAAKALETPRTGCEAEVQPAAQRASPRNACLLNSILHPPSHCRIKQTTSHYQKLALTRCVRDPCLLYQHVSITSALLSQAFQVSNLPGHDSSTRDVMPADRKPKVIHWVNAKAPKVKGCFFRLHSIW